MPTEKEKYSLELCRRRGIRDKPHPIITDSMLLEAMTVRSRNNGYQRLVQKNRDFFVTGPLMRCLDGDKYVDEKRENENFLIRIQEEFLRVPRGRRSHYRGEIQIRAFWDNIRLLIQTDEEDGEDSEEDYEEVNEEVNEKVKEMVNEKLNENVHEEVKGIESKSKLPFKDSTDEKVKSRPLRLVSEVGMDAVRLDLINGMEQDRLDGVSVSIIQILALAPLRPLTPEILASNDLGKFRHPRPNSTRIFRNKHNLRYLLPKQQS